MQSIGQKLHGFTIQNIVDLPEYRSIGVLAEHDKTGAQVFHTVNGDEENLFAFMFKTVPESSNGVAHILEHTVLCGSEAFPVKDPFLLLLKGSMQTFLNAFTYPDKTVYPASSTVEKDLFNLMEVYGDAVFFPQLKEDLFRQEGHRLELSEDGKLLRTGIVYNEMKGNYSTHDSVAGDWCYRSLFPDTPYRYDSGGDPKDIPSLTYQEFKDFHRRYYHPTNTQIYLYGNIPTERYLEFLDKRFLGRFDRIEALPPVPLQERWSEPRSIQVPYPSGDADQEETHSSVTLNWLLDPLEDRVKTLSWEILTEVLMGSPASPLQKAAAGTDLGEDLSSTSGFETELRQTVFSVGLQGCDRSRAAEVEALFLRELETQVRDGLNKELVEGTLRRFEFRSREIRGGGPFGLRLLRKIGRGWLHGLSPEYSLEFEPVMKEVRRRFAEEESYFEKLIQADLLANKHRSTVVVYPDPGQNQRDAESEAESLAELTLNLGQAEQAAFFDKVRAGQESLTKFQSEPDDPAALARIPFLDVTEIPRQVETIATEVSRINIDGVEIPSYVHDLYTNGVSYVDAVFSFEGFSTLEELLLPLWTSFVPIAGLPGRSYEEVSRDLALVSGGFAAYPEVTAGIDHLTEARSLSGDFPKKPVSQGQVFRHVYFRLKALDADLPKALNLAASLVAQADFSDLDHLAEVFYELRNDLRSSIVPGGSSYAALRAELGMHPSVSTEENLRGLTQYLFLEEIADRIQKEKKQKGTKTLEELAMALDGLRQRLIASSRLILNTTAETKAISGVQDALRAEAARFATEASTSALSATDLPILAEAAAKAAESLTLPEPLTRLELLEYPSKVAFAAAALPSSVLGTPEQAEEALLAHILRTGPLWEEVRMKGGAYGAHASSDGLAGIFSFASYRDPNTLKTLAVYEKALQSLGNSGLRQADLDQAKIGAVSKELKPLSPGERGVVGLKRSLYGISDRLRQRRRDLTLAIEITHIQKAATRLAQRMPQARKAILAGKELIEGVQAELSGNEAPVIRKIGR